MAQQLSIRKFDYEGFDTTARVALVGYARRGRKEIGAGLERMLALGEVIGEANDTLAKHGAEGRFGEWVEAELGISRSTAYNYMNAFAKFGDCPTVGQMAPTAVYLLAANNCPEKAVHEAIQSLNSASDYLRKEDAEEIIARYKPPKPPRKVASPASGEASRLTSDSASYTSTPDLPLDVAASAEPASGSMPSASGQGKGSQEAPRLHIEDDEPVACEDASKLFAKLDKALGDAIRLVDEINRIIPSRLCHEIGQSLDLAFTDIRRWKKQKRGVA